MEGGGRYEIAWLYALDVRLFHFVAPVVTALVTELKEYKNGNDAAPGEASQCTVKRDATSSIWYQIVIRMRDRGIYNM